MMALCVVMDDDAVEPEVGAFNSAFGPSEPECHIVGLVKLPERIAHLNNSPDWCTFDNIILCGRRRPGSLSSFCCCRRGLHHNRRVIGVVGSLFLPLITLLCMFHKINQFERAREMHINYDCCYLFLLHARSLYPVQEVKNVVRMGSYVVGQEQEECVS